MQTYYYMSENDDTVRAILFAVQMLMRKVHSTIGLAGPSDIDNAVAEFKESQEALSWARDIVTGIKQDSEMGIVLPGGEGDWKVELLHGNTGKAIDTHAVIERYDKRIATTVLADFVMLGQQLVGSFALASSKTKIFALKEITCKEIREAILSGDLDADYIEQWREEYAAFVMEYLYPEWVKAMDEAAAEFKTRYKGYVFNPMVEGVGRVDTQSRRSFYQRSPGARASNQIRRKTAPIQGIQHRPNGAVFCI